MAQYRMADAACWESARAARWGSPRSIRQEAWAALPGWLCGMRAFLQTPLSSTDTRRAAGRIIGRAVLESVLERGVPGGRGPVNLRAALRKLQRRPCRDAAACARTRERAPDDRWVVVARARAEDHGQRAMRAVTAARSVQARQSLGGSEGGVASRIAGALVTVVTVPPCGIHLDISTQRTKNSES